MSVIPKLFADFATQGESELWNIQISDQVTALIRQPSSAGTAICEHYTNGLYVEGRKTLAAGATCW